MITAASVAVAVERVGTACTLPDSRSTWFWIMSKPAAVVGSPAIQSTPINPPRRDGSGRGWRSPVAEHLCAQPAAGGGAGAVLSALSAAVEEAATHQKRPALPCVCGVGDGGAAPIDEPAQRGRRAAKDWPEDRIEGCTSARGRGRWTGPAAAGPAWFQSSAGVPSRRER